MPDGFAPLFRNEILHSVIRPFWDSPLPAEIEIVEFLVGDDVPRFASGFQLQDAVLHDPTFFRESAFPKTAPPPGAHAIEEQFPAFLLFFRCELVFRRLRKTESN